jgi:hypothetical protein
VRRISYETRSTGQNPNPGRLGLPHQICRRTAGESNHEIRSAFGQHALIAKQKGPTAKRSPPHVKNLRCDTARLCPLHSQHVSAANTAGNDGVKAILAMKAIELLVQLGTIAVVKAAADQNAQSLNPSRSP